FVYGDTPEPQSIRSVLDEIWAVPAGQAWELTIRALSERSNIRELPLQTMLVQLELCGLLASRNTYYAEYQFKYLIPSPTLLTHFEGEKQQFVQAILNCAKQARLWYTLDFEKLSRTYPAARSEVVTTLDYMAERGWIELESKQLTQVYNVLVPDFDRSPLSEDLTADFQAKEVSEIARLHAMLAFFASDQCLSQRLAAYFGDDKAPLRCGHCSVCHGQVAQLPEPAPLTSLAEQDFEALCGGLMARNRTQRGAPVSVETLTRFLCGLTTPLLTKLKIRNLPGFAALENYPYAEVRQWVQQKI
ncbi:MAG: RecQ family zinc-binding domain-containing protein, partial [Pseudomonadota bacterium]